MKRIGWFCIWVMAGFSWSLVNAGVVIPFTLDREAQAVVQDNEEAFVTVAYYANPAAEPLFEEIAERIWWVQDRAVLLLGATGEPLPASLTRRGTVLIQVWFFGNPLWPNMREIHPQVDGVRLSQHPDEMACSLSKALGKGPTMDATLLADVANYLAGNLASLDMMASSYRVEGYGEVVNAMGEWTGEPLSGGGSSVWSATGDNVYVQGKHVGIGLSLPQGQLHLGTDTTSTVGVRIDGRSVASGVGVYEASNAFFGDQVGIGLWVNQARTWGLFFDEINHPSSTVTVDGEAGLVMQGVGGTGIFLGRADQLGMNIGSSGDDGLRIGAVGSPSNSFASVGKNGVEIQGAEGFGVYIGQSDLSGIAISRAGAIGSATGFVSGSHGVSVANAQDNGFAIQRAGRDGFFVQEAAGEGFQVQEAGGDGLFVAQADGHGVNIGTVTGHGLKVQNPSQAGLYIQDAGTNGVEIAGSVPVGVQVSNAGQGMVIQDSGAYGISLIRSGWDAIAINGTEDGYHGIQIDNAGDHGVLVRFSGEDGVRIEDPGSDGVEIDGASVAGVRVYDSQYGLRSYSNQYGVYVSSCPIAGYFQGTGGGLSSPALRADATNTTNGIAAHFTNDSADSTVVIENDSASVSAHLIKGFRDGVAMFRVNNMGQVYGSSFNGGGADVAESFQVDEDKSNYEPGDVMVISTKEDRQMDVSRSAYCTRVAGVYATKPGVLLGPDVHEGNRVPVGVLGVIPTKVNLEGGPILRGDLLVTSSEAGVAMKADPGSILHGSVIGKALENFDAEVSGLIEVLVHVQ